ncbi:hscarg dehydrogenase [Aspergillus bombycis]|uniref:Hscarg dehydrogenase n=1 Tax=Aspergillus bombycis TaxID=109264 RepID=A0A1F8A7H4_9EURO|nr:hscarg dehydrogenase [Aspergillus bombycis]OGM47720.1 hscarg dehydrogenase [Aspergillus bombycis]
MKTITIVGATGNQGLSVADAFLPLPDWHVRCITRNPSSPKAQTLASLGASIVKADLADIASLRLAFVDSNVIFNNIDFWGPFHTTGSYEDAYEQEVQHGRNAAIAAATVPTLSRFVYSTLAPMKKHSGGKYPHSHHCDAKAEIMEFIETQTPELAQKTSYIIIGAYATNPLFMPRWNPDIQRYQFMVPLNKEQKMPIIAARESTGAFVKALIDEPPRTRLLAYDSDLTIGDIVEAWTRATGSEAELVEVDAGKMHEQMGIPWEVLDAFLFIGQFGYAGGIEGVIHPSQLKVNVQTESFETWLKRRNWEEVLQGGSVELNSVVGSVPRS